MANRTVGDAHTIHGKNPQCLIEKVIRTRIYESRYWKEECFALTAELLVDKACDMKFIGGLYSGSNKPTAFLCLLLKMLQIQPDKDIVIEFLKRNEFKYCRALAAFYLRLTGNSIEIYKYLETLYNDYSKLKRQDENGKFSIVHMDDFIDELLRNDRACSIILPRLQKRYVLESTNDLEPRLSILEEDLQELMLQAVEEEELEEARKKEEKRMKDSRKCSRSRSRDRNRKKRRSKTRSRSVSKKKSHRKSTNCEHEERKIRSKSPEKRHRRRSSERKENGYDKELTNRYKRGKKGGHRDRERERGKSRDRS